MRFSGLPRIEVHDYEIELDAFHTENEKLTSDIQQAMDEVEDTTKQKHYFEYSLEESPYHLEIFTYKMETKERFRNQDAEFTIKELIDKYVKKIDRKPIIAQKLQTQENAQIGVKTSTFTNDGIGVKPLSKSIVSFGHAMIFGKLVSQEEIERRFEICMTCPLVRRKDETYYCGHCGCGLARKTKLKNLAAFEEHEKWGCPKNKW